MYKTIILSINHCQFFSLALLSVINLGVSAFGQLADWKGSRQYWGNSKQTSLPATTAIWLKHSSLQQYAHTTIIDIVIQPYQ